MRATCAWALLAAYVALAAATVALVAFQGASGDGLGVLGVAGFAGVGTLIALRQPDNAVGWILLGICLTFASHSIGASYVAEASNPARVAAAWLTNWSTYLWFALAAVFLPLVFPHGRLPSPRWRPALWLGVAGMALGAAGSALTPGPLELDGPPIENPLGVGGGVPEVAVVMGTLTGAASFLLAAASLVVRFRRAKGGERQQLKWFAYVGVLAIAFLAVAVLGSLAFGDDLPPSVELLMVVAWLTGFALLVLGLPAATGIAIFRHRLYDVDAAIRRTLVYGALTATLGATYLALVLLTGLAVGESDIAVAASTLAVAALFRPARSRIQAIVDQRFYRRRYDAARTLEVFASRLRDELDLEALGADLSGVVRDTVQPAHVSLWLRSQT